MKTISEFIREGEALSDANILNLAARKAAANDWFQSLMEFMDEKHPDETERKDALVEASGYRVKEELVPNCLETEPPKSAALEKEVETFRTKLELVLGILRDMK